MSPEVIDYLLKRGADVDDGYILLPHRCQHLRLDDKLSEYKIEIGENDEQIKVLQTARYKCDIHDTSEYPVLCKRFHGHGRFYIPNGCVFLTKKDEDDEHNIYLKALTRKLTRQKKQSQLVSSGGVGSENENGV